MKIYNILIVDDEAENIRVIANILKKNDNYNFIYATNGEDALTRARENFIDLVLLDIMMTPMDGYSVCREMKKDESLKKIPIIFITAKIDSESIVEGFLVGGIDYILKPFNPYELEARVENQIKIRALCENMVENLHTETVEVLSKLAGLMPKKCQRNAIHLMKLYKIAYKSYWDKEKIKKIVGNNIDKEIVDNFLANLDKFK